MIQLAFLILGLCLGSFVNALVWRLHEQEVAKDSKGKKDSRNLSILRGRSMCTNCGHRLHARDLIPLYSWLRLRGRCRYCQKPIGKQYPVVELAMGAAVLFSFLNWPFGLNAWSLVIFGLWFVLLTILMALAVYDLKWMILPDKLVFAAFCVAIVITTILLVFKDGVSIWSPIWGIVCIAGLFYVLYQISKGKWIGGGDVKLGVVLGLLVGGPLMALTVIFFASVLGSMVGIPLVLKGKDGKKTKLPFGPLLIVATVIVFMFEPSLTSWYNTHILLK